MQTTLQNFYFRAGNPDLTKNVNPRPLMYHRFAATMYYFLGRCRLEKDRYLVLQRKVATFTLIMYMYGIKSCTIVQVFFCKSYLAIFGSRETTIYK